MALWVILFYFFWLISSRVAYASIFNCQVSLWLTNIGWPWLVRSVSAPCDFPSLSRLVMIAHLTISEIQGREGGTLSLLKPRLLIELSPLTFATFFDLRKSQSQTKVKGWRKETLLMKWAADHITKSVDTKKGVYNASQFHSQSTRETVYKRLELGCNWHVRTQHWDHCG